MPSIPFDFEGLVIKFLIVSLKSPDDVGQNLHAKGILTGKEMRYVIKKTRQIMYFCCTISIQFAVLLFMYFFKCPYNELQSRRYPKNSCFFYHNSFKSEPLQMKIIPKLNSKVLNISTSKRRGKAFKQCKNKLFSMVLFVLNSTSWQDFTTVCSKQRVFCFYTQMDKRQTCLITQILFVLKEETH